MRREVGGWGSRLARLDRKRCQGCCCVRADVLWFLFLFFGLRALVLHIGRKAVSSIPHQLLYWLAAARIHDEIPQCHRGARIHGQLSPAGSSVRVQGGCR